MSREKEHGDEVPSVGGHICISPHIDAGSARLQACAGTEKCFGPSGSERNRAVHSDPNRQTSSKSNQPRRNRAWCAQTDKSWLLFRSRLWPVHPGERSRSGLYISPDRPLFSTNNGSPTAILDYHTDSVNAPAAWAQGLNGSGIGVAVIDSGIIDIPDLHGQNNLVVFSQNFVGGTSGSANDQFGHGSHVAGIIAGTVTNSTGSNYP